MRTESVTAVMRTNSVTFATRPRTAVEERPRKASSYRDASGCSWHQCLSERAVRAAKFVTFSLHLASGSELCSPRRQGNHGSDPGVSPSTRPSLRIQHSQALHAAAAQPLAKPRSSRARAGCARRWRVPPPSHLHPQVVHGGAARLGARGLIAELVTYIFASAWIASAVRQPRRMTWVAVVPLLTWRSQGSRQSRQ